MPCACALSLTLPVDLALTAADNSRRQYLHGTQHGAWHNRRKCSSQKPRPPLSPPTRLLEVQPTLIISSHLLCLAGPRTVIHPKARIIAEAGPIIIGEGNLIEEQALIINA